jgi:L-ribulose-5-phosphate 3-epimerase
VRMVRNVDRENVGILLDFAWVHLAGRESAREAVSGCLPYLVHCHYKDWLIEPGGTEPVWHARLMGEGTIPWRDLFAELVRCGYDGPASDEYERYWHPQELPPARIGMKHNLEYVRRCLRGDSP